MSTNLASEPLEDWITQAEAARLRGVTRQAIARLIQRGRLEIMQIGGVTFVRKSAIESFEAAPAGRKGGA